MEIANNEWNKGTRTESKCLCGRTAKYNTGTVKFTIHSKDIQLIGVPHFHCSYCDRSTFSSETEVELFLKHAYKNGLSVIQWEERFKKN